MKVYIYKMEIADVPDYDDIYRYYVLEQRDPGNEIYSNSVNWVAHVEALETPVERLRLYRDGEAEQQNLVIVDSTGPIKLFVEALKNDLGNARSMWAYMENENKQIHRAFDNINLWMRTASFWERLVYLFTRRLG